jgi:hypothetical protein
MVKETFINADTAAVCAHPQRLLRGRATGVPRSYETATPQDPTVGLCLGPYGGPRGADVLL